MRHTRTVTCASETSCRGHYIEVCVEKILVNVPVETSSIIESHCIDEPVTLVRVLFSNFWKYRIGVFGRPHNTKLIDSHGIQHSTLSADGFDDVVIKLSKSQQMKVVLNKPEYDVEPGAATRGWLWFSQLGKKAFPQRLVFSFDIFENDSTCGSVVDTEIVDFTFSIPNLRAIPELVNLKVD